MYGAPETPRWKTLLKHLADAEARGINPERLAESLVSDRGGAKDACALLAWKIDDFLHGTRMADIERARQDAHPGRRSR